MKNYLVFSVLIYAWIVLPGQSIMNRDSLIRLLPLAKNDTNTVKLYINIGQQYETNEPETAKQYYRKAGELSKKLGYTKGVISFINNYTFILNMQGNYDSSLLLNLLAVNLSKKSNDSLNLAKTLFNTGTSYRNLGEYESAVHYYEEGKQIFQKLGDEGIGAIGDDILQLLYYQMHQFTKGIQYGESSVSKLRKLDNPAMLGTSLTNLGLNYLSVENFGKASALFNEALEISIKIGDKNMEQSQYMNMGDVFLKKGDFEKMKLFMDKALDLSKKLELHESQLIATLGLSFYFHYKKNYKLAEKYVSEALTLSYRFNLRIQRQRVFAHFSALSYAMQDIKQGEYYATQSTLLGDSILSETIQKNTLKLEKKYESEKKVNQIKQLEADKKLQQLSIRQKNTLNYFLIAGAATLLIITLLSYRTFKQRQKLQQQRIGELETQQQLIATEAVLKGEEQERTRLAKDLHDGLGGMLSGIKYSFTTMKGNLVMTPENHQAFERSMDMLDSSISEMRRVAHNMMPETLVRFGLDTALKDFCNEINQSGALKINYQSIGLEGIPIDQTTAITLYRIIQELINNTMKHANATTAIVQVTKLNGQLSVTVEDDGNGFDISILNNNKGIGWVNMKNRVEFLKGKLDIKSKEGEGTSAQIELYT
ncbi:MAG: sensor histidine kinase [Bacteroidales bacterium]|nr:sensor histidine kinase [Bacteroidales bacterium]